MSNLLCLSPVETPFGKMIVGINDNAVCVMRFFDKAGNRSYMKRYAMEAGFVLTQQKTSLHGWVEKEMNQFFNGERTSFNFPVKLFGNDFQISVWLKILKLKLAENIDLKTLAKFVGVTNMKAVERACRENPVSMVVPSHRVEGFSEFEGAANRKILLNRFESFFKEKMKLKIAA